MSFTPFKIAGALVLAASLIGTGAQAANLKLKSKEDRRGIARPAASKVLKGNGTGVADLIVRPYTSNTSGMPNTGVCGNWQNGYQSVRFRVRNTGNAASGPTNLNLIFATQGPFAGNVIVNVPGLGPNQSAVISAGVPNAAQPGYSQTMKVTGVVNAAVDTPEQSVENNSAVGYCHGPAS